MLSFYQKMKIIPIIVLAIALILILIAVFPATNGGVKIEKDKEIEFKFSDDFSEVTLTGQYSIVSDMSYSFDDVYFIVYLKNDDGINEIIEKGSFTIPAKSSYEIPFTVTEKVVDIIPYLTTKDGQLCLQARAEIQGAYYFDLFNGDIILDFYIKAGLWPNEITDMLGIE